MAKQAETGVWKMVRLVLSPVGFRLFRNQRYKGPIVRNGKVTDSWADCGLVDGASDLIGWRSFVITADMVGKRIAQFCAFETKIKGKPSDDQNTFLSAVKRDGGVAEVVYNEDDLKKHLTPPSL
jgi:hypothetical protein